MRLPLTFAFSLLAGLAVLALDSACLPGSTVVLVTDCNNAPVSGAHIDIKICCAAPQTTFSTVSANNGEATFSLNAQNICDGKVTFAGFSATSFGTGSCSKPDKNGISNCTVKVCKQ